MAAHGRLPVWMPTSTAQQTVARAKARRAVEADLATLDATRRAEEVAAQAAAHADAAGDGAAAEGPSPQVPPWRPTQG
jgi:hypothetical protein